MTRIARIKTRRRDVAPCVALPGRMVLLARCDRAVPFPPRTPSTPGGAPCPCAHLLAWKATTHPAKGENSKHA